MSTLKMANFWHAAVAEAQDVLDQSDVPDSYRVPIGNEHPLVWRIRQLIAQRDAARADNIALRTALAHYTDATVVSSWGYQELGDIGGAARDALTQLAPGAALLRELEAARAVIAGVRQLTISQGWVNWEVIEEPMRTYYAACRAESEAQR